MQDPHNTPPPFALFIRGQTDRIFALSDELGFDMEMQALAVSVFEDGPNSMHVQALFATEAQAEMCQLGLSLDGLEHFITQLPDEDWTAKSQAGLPPVPAGRFFIYGTHDADKIPDGTPHPIQINAGIAFGTGHHGTTKGCLLAFEQILQSRTLPNNILDLGCGAGILAIAAAKALPHNAPNAPITITATDIDEDAVTVTRENAALNNVKDRLNAFQADGLSAQNEYDLIFANILAGPLLGLAPDIVRALAPKGKVILSGILEEQADTLIAAYQKAGLQLDSHDILAGWSTLIMHHP